MHPLLRDRELRFVHAWLMLVAVRQSKLPQHGAQALQTSSCGLLTAEREGTVLRQSHDLFGKAALHPPMRLQGQVAPIPIPQQGLQLPRIIDIAGAKFDALDRSVGESPSIFDLDVDDPGFEPLIPGGF